MVIKLYISGISGNKEVKKKQQRVQMILDSKQINYEAIDITEPGKEKDKEFMQQNGKVRESLGKYPLPPQIFNDDDFCGDYEDFDMANEVDELEKFLHIETKDIENGSKQNEKSGAFYDKNKESTDSLYNPYEYHTFTLDVNGLKEEITNINSLVEEKERTEEMTESEVNGETESAPAPEPSNESITESIVDTSADGAAAAPEKEESTAENEIATAENDKEENAEDEGKEREPEMPEKEEENEVADNPKEEEVESSEKPEEKNEEEEENEKAGEEEETAEDVESKEKIASEEEESESEKSQEE